MNKKELSKLIEPFILEIKNLDDRLIFNDLSIHLGQAKKGQIIFYYLEEGKEDKFLSRYTEGDFLLVVNRVPGNLKNPKNLMVIKEDHFLHAQKVLLDKLYPLERASFKLIGITGTNGKTTVAHLCREISTGLGHKAVSIGTLGVNSCEELLEDFGMTTPYYILLRKILSKYQKDYDAFFIEVSSHGLGQRRLFELQLDAAVWTSFSRDHLDYHHNMDDYFKTKTKIFDYIKTPLIIPTDQKELMKNLAGFKLQKATRLDERKIYDIPPSFKGGFNQENLEVSLEVNERVWGSLKGLDLHKLKGPEGRSSVVAVGDSFVIIDYAHTPDALENILIDLKNKFPGLTINLLFGCGGDRDRGKRPKMGEIAAKFVDKGKIYLTSDNPRGENPLDIITDIKAGIKSLNLEVIVERKKAMDLALTDLKEGEILLVAGKGHEKYQEIAGVKYPFSDFKVVEDFKNGSK
ncbi:MAG: UDP-N-acetylmuramoyl-L-alanyl-D-glutamate--2,6-diaminopimelate ligase [Deltaproteobacteria bacterium]|nr:MAG: UDP-N-acetylmuramoyl-L-alanyl-D-glutamate--2,6-diaminopimelate ligase [Deltaproteobacteria bacterium]